MNARTAPAREDREDEGPTPAAAIIRRYIAADDERAAVAVRVAQVQAELLRASGKVGELASTLARAIPAGEAVTIRVSADEAVTVSVSPAGGRPIVSVQRSRLLFPVRAA